MGTSFADRLRMVIGNQKPTPWAQARGISGTTIHDWLVKGMKPYPKSLDKLVTTTGIPARWWLSGEAPPPSPDTSLMAEGEGRGLAAGASNDQGWGDGLSGVSYRMMDAGSGAQAYAGQAALGEYVSVPYYSLAATVETGGPKPEPAFRALLFSRDFIVDALHASPEVMRLVQVTGDSMQPTLHAGWSVMVDTSRRTVCEGIFAVRFGGTVVCKRLEARPGGVIRVSSDNRMYDEYEISAGDGDTEFDVLGKVVWFSGLVA